MKEGGIVIDTPGMRELQLWVADEDMGHSFSDIEELASQCRFRDCQQATEPGCTIQAVLSNATLDKARYMNYVKLQRELAYLIRKENQRAKKSKVPDTLQITEKILLYRYPTPYSEIE